MFNGYAALASFLGAGVEFVEALTIILAVGVVRGWRSGLSGGLSALALLALLVGIIGAPLTKVMELPVLQFLVGLFMLFFGSRWLRKAVLRYAGLKSMHNEAENFEKELARQRAARGVQSTKMDRVGFVTAFSGTFLEGLEAILIVLAFGLGTHSMSSAVTGALAALAGVTLLGISLRKPLSRVPENAMKFVVGLMLTSFGVFWLGESFGLPWPQSDLSILYLLLTFAGVSFVEIWQSQRLTRSQNSFTHAEQGSAAERKA